MQYLVIVEKAEENYSAYFPDVPGCVTTGRTLEETMKNAEEALTLHFDGMFADGEETPEACSQAHYLEFDWQPNCPDAR